MSRAGGMPYDRPMRSGLKVIAHRGASWWAPEETKPAYLLASALGADFLELDLQRTKDGILVAYHDDDVSRTTDAATVFPGRERAGIGAFTLEELRRLDDGGWFNRRFRDRARWWYAGERILPLADVLAIAGPERGCYIETKLADRYPGIEEQLIETLRAHGALDRAWLQSFEPESLRTLSRLAPAVPRTLLVTDGTIAGDGWDSILGLARDLGARAVGFPWRHAVRRPGLIGRLRDAGLAAHPWTVNARWAMRALTWLGAGAIFTDRCEVLLRQLGRPAPASPDALLARSGY